MRSRYPEARSIAPSRHAAPACRVSRGRNGSSRVSVDLGRGRLRANELTRRAGGEFGSSRWIGAWPTNGDGRYQSGVVQHRTQRLEIDRA
jgi:hypothetical protein